MVLGGCQWASWGAAPFFHADHRTAGPGHFPADGGIRSLGLTMPRFPGRDFDVQACWAVEPACRPRTVATKGDIPFGRLCYSHGDTKTPLLNSRQFSRRGATEWPIGKRSSLRSSFRPPVFVMIDIDLGSGTNLDGRCVFPVPHQANQAQGQGAWTGGRENLERAWGVALRAYKGRGDGDGVGLYARWARQPTHPQGRPDFTRGSGHNEKGAVYPSAGGTRTIT